MDLTELKAQDEKLNTAEWVGDLPGLKDLRLKVLPLSSPLVIKMWARKQRRAPREAYSDDGLLDADFEEQIDTEIYAEAVLQGWENLEQDGEAIEFSPKMAKTLMEISVFERAVRVAAMRVTQELAQKQELIEGNS